jgi:tryptophan synthase alpha chain
VTAQRIEDKLAALREAKRTALVAYLTVGDPSVEQSLACARAALDAGADLLELGVPFSDPTADGSVIAAASYRAIQQGGSLRAALRVAEELRLTTEAPLVLFSYYNPILAFGERRVAEEAARIGVDGLLVVDLPPEEGAELRAAAQDSGLAVIPLVAPTTDREREPRVVHGARGFVYYVSLTGITGASSAPLEQAGRAARALRQRFGLPVVVGFGIDSPQKAQVVAAQGADGVVVGTAIVKAIAAASDDAGRVEAVRALVGALRAGLDELAPVSNQDVMRRGQ